MTGNPKGSILIVEANRRNLELLAEFFSQTGYHCTPAATVAQIDQILENPNGIHLALVDIAGFSQSIWERCHQIHAAGIQVIIISPHQSYNISEESYRLGAAGVLIKPLVMRELASLIQNLLSHKA
jgi:DNA-binding response OmpR family regulator